MNDPCTILKGLMAKNEVNYVFPKLTIVKKHIFRDPECTPHSIFEHPMQKTGATEHVTKLSERHLHEFERFDGKK